MSTFVSKIKPFGPRESTQWLSDKNIDSICRLFEKDYPNYKHLGVLMSDLFVVRGEHEISPKVIEDYAK